MAGVTACGTLGYAAYDLATAAERISARGFQKIEICEMGAYCRHLPFKKQTSSPVEKVLSKHGLRPVALNASTSRIKDGKISFLSHSDPEAAAEALEQGRWFLERAKELEIPSVTFEIGPQCSDQDWDLEMKASCAVYREVAAIAGDYGISLNLEVPHLQQLTNTVVNVRRVFERIDHPAVGATVDSSHWGIMGYNLADFLAFLAARLKHVHLRDSIAGENEDLELTPGDGTVNFKEFGESLDRLNYPGEVSLEFEYRFQGLDRIEKEYDKGIAHLKQCGWEFPKGVS